MQLVYADRVQETSTTTGTGTYTLAGAVTGFQSFAAIGDGKSCLYVVEDGTNWEVGVGTYTSSGTTLSRDRILSSSNGGSAVNWAAGTRNVFVDASAKQMRWLAINHDPAYGLLNDTETPDITGGGHLAIGHQAVASNVDAVCVGPGTASGSGSLVLSNNPNTVASGQTSMAIGYNAQATNDYACAIQGTASGYVATAIKATASGDYSLAVGGQSNTVNKPYSAALGGNSAATRTGYSDVFGGGLNSAQRAMTIVRADTADATPTVLQAGADAATNGYMAWPANMAIGFTGIILGRSSTVSKMVEIKGLIKTDGSGNPTLVGSSSTVLWEDTNSWTVVLSVESTNDSLVVTVTGAAATTIHWVGNITFVEIS